MTRAATCPPPRPAPPRPSRGGAILQFLGLLLLAGVLVILYLLRGPLLYAAAQAWIVDEAAQPSDAIVLLSNDNFAADRATRAAELYRSRWAPRIVASGVYLRPYATVAELMRRDLVERGVAPEAVLPFPHRGGNTREEAYAVRGLLRERQWKRVLVVTSNYHARRARFIWRRVADPGMEVRVLAARDAEFDPRTWWRTRLGWKRFLSEWIGFGVALFEMRRLDPAPRPAPPSS